MWEGLEALLICSFIASEGNGSSFPIRASSNVCYSNHNHSEEGGVVITDRTGSESEVEIYAVDDQNLERQPLAL